MTRTALFSLLLLALVVSPLYAQETRPQIADIQALLDAGQADLALEQAQRLVRKKKNDAEALLMRGTAHAMLGDVAAAFADFQSSVEADPRLRQGWLNLAGLEIAEARFDAAYEALLKAQEIDPNADDNHLNLGTVLLMSDRFDEARSHFEAYLQAHPNSADAAFLVAGNYALRGRADGAVEHLRRAVEIDERMRLRARSDDRFLTLDESPAYRRLLGTDTWTKPADWHERAAAFQQPYRSKDPKLVYAVLEALGELGLQYDPKIETTLEWALIWGEVRIKLYNQPNGTGVVAVYAPPERFSTDSWHRTSQEIFRAVQESLSDVTTRRPSTGTP